jgi:hypothetical protein
VKSAENPKLKRTSYQASGEIIVPYTPKKAKNNMVATVEISNSLPGLEDQK